IAPGDQLGSLRPRGQRQAGTFMEFVTVGRDDKGYGLCRPPGENDQAHKHRTNRGASRLDEKASRVTCRHSEETAGKTRYSAYPTFSSGMLFSYHAALFFRVTPMEFVLYLVLGAFAGVLAGLSAVGGGMVILPVLVFSFSLQAFAPEIPTHLTIGPSLSTI